MRTPSDLPPDARSGPFAVGADGAAGVSRRRTRARDLVAPFRGVRDHAAPIGQAELARALAVVLEPDEAFSHHTAAAILGMRTPPGPAPSRVDVMTFGGRRPMRRLGVAAHRGGDACGRTMLDGLPVLDPVETWLHLGAALDVDDLVMMADGLVRRGFPAATLERLSGALAGHRRLVGAPRLREAIAWVRPGTDSARETALRLLLVRAGFPEPEVNGEIRNEFGAVIAHGDLVWRTHRVVVEYEGDHHRTDRRQFAIDIDRIGGIQALGWSVLRVDAGLFARPRVLFDRLATAFSRANDGP